MNKKILILIILIIAILFSVIAFLILKDNNKEHSNNTSIESNKISNNAINENKVKDKNIDTVYIKVNNQVLDVELENNSATRELREKLKNEDIVVEVHEYGGFEKVGDLGFSLPREDTNVTTSAGDIVLYQGNQISLFYNSNSWSYTRLGKIQDITTNELKSILGNGDVSLTFTLSR